MILPKKLNKNSTIGIITPSSVLKGSQLEEFETGKQVLENYDFKIYTSENFNIDNLEAKLSDFHRMFENKNIDAIICAQGGDKSQELIPNINWEIIKNNPKVFMGMSDITPFLNAISIKSGLVAYHGPDVRSILGKGFDKYSMKSIETSLINGQKGYVEQHNITRKVIRSGKASGKAIGGNLKCFLKLIDLGYEIDFQGKILFLETLDFDPNSLNKYFSLLISLGAFDKIAGIVTGYIFHTQKIDYDNQEFESILMEYAKDFSFPILKINEFGHRCENAVIPIGCEVELDTDELSLKIVEDFIK